MVVDPDSPAGKEYAIPTDAAHRAAAQALESGGEPDATGVDGAAGASGRDDSGAGGNTAADRERVGPDTNDTSGMRGATPLAEGPEPEAGSSSSIGWIVGSALAVLVVGGAAGFGARRRLRAS